MAERQYVGKGKRVGKFGNIRIGVKPADLPVNARGWCNLIVSEMKKEDEWGNQFTVYVDDWTPEKKEEPGF